MKLNAIFSDSPVLRQTILSICTSMCFFCIGLVRGYSAPAVPSILENDPYLLPTKSIASWASSVPPCGAFAGSILAIFALQYIGRRNTIIMASPISAIGWALIATPANHTIIIIGRFITGFAVGFFLPSAQVYIGESCDPAIRGILSSFPTILMSLGIVVAYVIGSLVKWNILAWISCAISLSFSLTLFFLPESPVWLRSKNRHGAADKSMAWLKLPNVGLCRTNRSDNIAGAPLEKYVDFDVVKEKPRNVYFTRPILLPLLIGLTLLVIQQVSGIDAVIFFTVEIFRRAGSTINEHLATIIVGTVQLVSNISALFVVDRAGRKPLLIASGVIMCLSMASMGTSFYLNDIGNNKFGYLPLTSLIVFMIGFSIGFGCIPFVLLGELFPAKQRSVLSSIASSCNLGFMFIVIKTYHYLEEAITTAGTYWMYSVFCALGVIFVIAVVPETKGRDLESIAKLFVKNSDEVSPLTVITSAEKRNKDESANDPSNKKESKMHDGELTRF